MVKQNSPKIKETALLHTPEELLAGAEALLSSSDEQMMRVVVLEAITALESFVYQTVFTLLRNKLDPLLVNWLEKKTNFDFDSRLSTFTEYALDREINKRSILWDNYRKAKEIRNRVTHTGLKVSYEEAKFVLDTVHDWLSFLGSTAEVDIALLGLKKYIEREKTQVNFEKEAINIVLEYFRYVKNTSGKREGLLSKGRNIDLTLTFGDIKVYVETKFIHRDTRNLKFILKDMIAQITKFIIPNDNERIALIVFYKGVLPYNYKEIITQVKGKISAVVIQVK